MEVQIEFIHRVCAPSDDSEPGCIAGCPGLIVAYAAEVEFEKVKRTALISNLRTASMVAALPAASKWMVAKRKGKTNH